MEQETKYYHIYPGISFCCYPAKGTYNAVFQYGIKKLKEDYEVNDPSETIDYETGEHAKNYEQLLTIVEQSSNDLIELIQGSDFAGYFPEMENENWILEHRDDFYTILNEDGTVAKKNIY